MKKIMVETATALREFDSESINFLKGYKAYLIVQKVPYREFEFEIGQDIGLRGKAGAMYSEMSA